MFCEVPGFFLLPLLGLLLGLDLLFLMRRFMLSSCRDLVCWPGLWVEAVVEAEAPVCSGLPEVRGLCALEWEGEFLVVFEFECIWMVLPVATGLPKNILDLLSASIWKLLMGTCCCITGEALALRRFLFELRVSFESCFYCLAIFSFFLLSASFYEFLFWLNKLLSIMIWFSLLVATPSPTWWLLNAIQYHFNLRFLLFEYQTCAAWRRRIADDLAGWRIFIQLLLWVDELYQLLVQPLTPHCLAVTLLQTTSKTSLGTSLRILALREHQEHLLLLLKSCCLVLLQLLIMSRVRLHPSCILKVFVLEGRLSLLRCSEGWVTHLPHFLMAAVVLNSWEGIEVETHSSLLKHLLLCVQRVAFLGCHAARVSRFLLWLRSKERNLLGGVCREEHF